MLPGLDGIRRWRTLCSLRVCRLGGIGSRGVEVGPQCGSGSVLAQWARAVRGRPYPERRQHHWTTTPSDRRPHEDGHDHDVRELASRCRGRLCVAASLGTAPAFRVPAQALAVRQPRSSWSGGASWSAPPVVQVAAVGCSCEHRGEGVGAAGSWPAAPPKSTAGHRGAIGSADSGPEVLRPTYSGSGPGPAFDVRTYLPLRGAVRCGPGLLNARRQRKATRRARAAPRAKGGWSGPDETPTIP